MPKICVPAAPALEMVDARKQARWKRWGLAVPLVCSLLLSPLHSNAQSFPPRSSKPQCTVKSQGISKPQDASPRLAITQAIWSLFSAITKGEAPDMQKHPLIKKVRNTHYYYVELPMFDAKSLLETADNMQRRAIDESKGTMLVNIVPDLGSNRIYMDTRKVELPRALNEINVAMLEKIIQIDIAKGKNRKTNVPYLTGRGLELYANIPSKLMALISDGKVIKVYPAAFGAPFDKSTHSPIGHFTLKDADIDQGWLIPPARAINFEYFLKSKRFKSMRYYQNTILIDTNSFLCLMGDTKVRVNNPYDEFIMVHGRRAIFPATQIPVPAGMERSIKDDIPDQTTNACICIFDGSFYRLDGDRDLILNGDIIELMNSGSITAPPLNDGDKLPLRKGGNAYLSKDKWGNPTWFKNDGTTEIVSFKYDINWSDSKTPLVAWIARQRGNSQVFKALSENRISRICIDYRSHYMEEDGRIKVIFFYDPYGKFNWQKEMNIVIDELKNMGFEMNAETVKIYFDAAAESGATLWYNKY